jgi:hypothetical protein
MNAITAHLLIQMNDDFCVGVRGQPVTPALEFGTELREVVYLSVENDPD